MNLSPEQVERCLAKFGLLLISNSDQNETPQKIYLIIMNDRHIRKPVLIATLEQFVDIEAQPFQSSGILISEALDPLWGVRNYQITSLASELNLSRDLWRDFEGTVKTFFDAYMHFDCSWAKLSIEINANERFNLVDADMIVDTDALFRHSELQNEEVALSEWELLRKKLNYIDLKGQIGCIVNGAGLAMALNDMICHYSNNQIQPANFLDICGHVTSDLVVETLLMLASDKNIQVVLVNIFGGMVSCDEVANGVISGCQSALITLPIILRFEGNNAQKAQEMVINAGLRNLELADSLTDAVNQSIGKVTL